MSLLRPINNWINSIRALIAAPANAILPQPSHFLYKSGIKNPNGENRRRLASRLSSDTLAVSVCDTASFLPVNCSMIDLNGIRLTDALSLVKNTSKNGLPVELLIPKLK